MTEGARVIEVIETRLLRRGDGRGPETPIRIVTQYWTLDGELLAEVDPVPNGIWTR
jgi:hypothetical protein